MADIASETIDAPRLTAVAAAVGPGRLRELIAILAGRIEAIAGAAETFPDSVEDFLSALHQSRGSAASLGFSALAEGLARMEMVGRQAEAGTWDAVREIARTLPALWKEAVRAKEALLF